MQRKNFMLVLLCGLSACQGQIVSEMPLGPSTRTADGPFEPPREQDDLEAIDAQLESTDPTAFEFAIKYFPGLTTNPGPTSLARLTQLELDLTAKDLLGDEQLTSIREYMPNDPRQTNYEYPEHLRIHAANFEPYRQWSDQVASKARPPLPIRECALGNLPCLRTAAASFVRKAFRNAVQEEVVSRFVDFFLERANESTVEEALRDLVRVTLTSPGFIFRDEVGVDANQFLLPPQQLGHLTYALADAPPSAIGFSEADADHPIEQATVERVLASELTREKLMRFFQDWLEIKQSDAFNFSRATYPEFTGEVAVALAQETREFLTRQLSGEAPQLSLVARATEAFVSRETAFLYDVEPPTETAVVATDPERRLGVFSHPGFIASHSGPTDTRLVHRGVFFTRKVMCLELGAPPEGTDTTLAEVANATERQRVEQATQGSPCSGCHQFINPFGFALENFDPIGRWRELDHGLPINASIDVDFFDEGPVSAATAVEALDAFTKSVRFEQCFVRQLFRYYMGRDENAGDDPVLRQMFFEFTTNDQDILGALRVLALSSHFSQRSEVQ